MAADPHSHCWVKTWALASAGSLTLGVATLPWSFRRAASRRQLPLTAWPARAVLNTAFVSFPLRHRLPSQHAGAAVVIYRHLAIDQHVGDAGRVLAGIVEGGGVHHPLGVEQRDVGVVALLDAAALRDAEAPGRAVGHAVHHPLHRDCGELAPQAAQ